MEVKYKTLECRAEWNDFIAKEPAFGLLQSWEWGEFKEKLGWKAFRIAIEQKGEIIAGAQLLIKSFIPGLASFAYIPRGPVGNWLNPEIAPRLFSEIHRVALRYKAIFLKIEPPLINDRGIDRILRRFNFRSSASTNQPRATIILDLKMDLNDILIQMRKKTRQYISAAGREGISIRVGTSEDLAAFYRMIRATSQREHFPSRVRSYYELEWQTFAASEQSILLIANYRDQPIAVRTAHFLGKHAAEFHAASAYGFPRLHPNYLLVWEAIKWAKQKGCLTYDLWGIPDEIGQINYEGNDLPISNRTDGLWGVYRFKSGFSKNVVYYIGAYDFVYNFPFYKLVTNKIFNRELLNRVSVLTDLLKSS